jgi:hypothetical protein
VRSVQPVEVNAAVMLEDAVLTQAEYPVWVKV